MRDGLRHEAKDDRLARATRRRLLKREPGRAAKGVMRAGCTRSGADFLRTPAGTLSRKTRPNAAALLLHVSQWGAVEW
jgi:hypothetical protein